MPFRPIDLPIDDDDCSEESSGMRQGEEETKDEPKKKAKDEEEFSFDPVSQNMIGIESSEHNVDLGGGILYKLGCENISDGRQTLDLSKVISFGCSSKCTFFLLSSDSE